MTAPPLTPEQQAWLDGLASVPPETAAHCRAVAEDLVAGAVELAAALGQIDHPVRLTIGVMVQLAGVVALRRIEEAGLVGVLAADLPTADEALVAVLARAEAALELPVTTAGLMAGCERALAAARRGEAGPLAVWRLVDGLAWAGRRELGADVALLAGGDDALVEAVAQALWAGRPTAAGVPA